MSVTGDDFAFGGLGLDPVENGTSVLLTGEDADAVETLFYRLVAGEDDETSVVLATDSSAREVKRELGDASDRARILTCDGPDRDENVRRIADLTDLTALGMEFSTEVAEAQTDRDRFRAGILLCSSILDSVEDTRSVYRFLNSNFLNHFRRGDAIGVCAVDTSVDLGGGTQSTIKGLETSFSGRIHVEDATRTEATVTVSGLGAQDGEHTVSL